VCIAINGTVGLLECVYKNAPTVKRVVITSSSAAILDQSQPTKTFSEVDWCPVTEKQALEGPANGYRASKTFAVSRTLTSDIAPGLVGKPLMPTTYRNGQPGSLWKRRNRISHSLW
jgi:nucleoside-diphosphate-sugar epimerase